jgi:Tol biopolymer transport system component
MSALLLLPAASQAQYFGKNKVRYRDFDWQIYSSPHFDVYFYPEERDLLQKVVSFAESAYDHLSQEFDYRIQEQTTLIFYDTHSRFEQNNIILNFIPEGTGAFATPVRNRMVLPVDLPDPELMELILHELTHIFQYHILFQGNLGKGVASTPPLWFMEGMASYMAQDESARDRMFLRDATVNDRIPPVSRANIGGFFAYRFGHAVFEFIEERWGKEGFRDFIIETRNTLGGRVGRAVERTFQMSPEDFDAEFRRWLRRRYLAELLVTGEPGDFGRPFRIDAPRQGMMISPAASPSGDLVAAFATYKGDVDVVLLDAENRNLLRNLTKGYSSDFQYFVSQELTLGRKMGRDIAFSPDGNSVAFFARKGEGRVLVIVDVLKGKRKRVIQTDVEQQLSPAFSPDGRRVAFSGYRDGRFDIFELDLETEEVSNITSDDVFDGAPVYSPDGRSLVLSSVVGGYSKLFRLDLDNPVERVPLREGVRTKTNETDAAFSPDGKRVFFTSDATGANNIYSVELESGATRQHTNSVTGCFMPTVLSEPDGDQSLVFASLWQGRFDLFRLDLDDPITEPELIKEERMETAEAMSPEDLPRFQPSIEVTIDEESFDNYGGFKFFLDGVSGGTIGISDDQTFIAALGLSFSDFLGDRRILGRFQSIESFQNFDVFYLDLSKRLQWQVHLFDNRDFFYSFDRRTGRAERLQSYYELTGAVGSLIYPVSTNLRVEAGLGYLFRDVAFQTFAFGSDGRPILDDDGNPIPIVEPRADDYPVVQAAVVGDSTVFAPWGAVAGRRWRLAADYAPNTSSADGESGTLTSTVYLDFRQYLPVTRRSNFAFRFFGSASTGEFRDPVYFGGLDTVRGFDFRSLVGDRGFYSNLEFRFPVVDQFASRSIPIRGLRAVVFLDVAGAWFDDVQDFDLWDSGESRLEDAVSSYGWGVTFNMLGLDVNIDFAKVWDLKTTQSGFGSSFWIGTRF